MASNNLSKFKKASVITETAKKRIHGEAEKKPHDTSKEAARYYSTSTGGISKAKTLSKKNPKLFNRVIKGQLTLDCALSIVRSQDTDDAFFNFIDERELSNSNVRTLARIHADDSDFYKHILATENNLADEFAKFGFKKRDSDLFEELKNGSI